MTNRGFVPLVATLKRLLSPPVGRRPGARCELCGATLAADHGHIADIRTRRLLCACGTCGTAGVPASRDAGVFPPAPQSDAGRYRAVPARYVHGPSMTISPSQWDALAIPVDLAFFFFNSDLGRTIACYPGPAGATESLLPLSAWPALVDANPWIQTLAPDVEALLVRRIDGRYVCFLVPIDACYELAGRIRTGWTGLGGGETVGGEIDRFFAALLDRCAPASPEGFVAPGIVQPSSEQARREVP